MVSRLLHATQAWLGHEHAVAAAVLTSPDCIRLTDEEIGDIFDRLKLRNLIQKPRSLYQIYATSAAYAGYGKGLCPTYTDAYTCEREESQLAVHRVLHIDYDPESLSGTIRSLQSASEPSVDACFIDPDLGSGRDFAQLTSASVLDDSSDSHWTAVSELIRELAKSLNNRVYMPHVTDLVLTGSSATDKHFQGAVRAALEGHVIGQDTLAILKRERGLNSQTETEAFFSFATARRAAEVAKLKQEGPIGCAQSDECRRRSDSVHGENSHTFLSQEPDGRPIWYTTSLSFVVVVKHHHFHLSPTNHPKGARSSPAEIISIGQSPGDE